jgi:hypothetical protein
VSTPREAKRLLDTLDAAPAVNERLFRAAVDARVTARSAALTASLHGLDMSRAEVDAHLRKCGLSVPNLPASPFCVGTPEQRDVCSRTGCPRDPVCGN